MIPVLYVAGAGRSGSTLLEMVLGNLPGFFSVGEVRYFWEYWQAGDRLCGCGQPLQTCEFWSSVNAGLERAEINTAQMADWASRYDRTRNLPRLARENGRSLPVPFIMSTAQLYQTIQAESGASILVDSSKVPSHLYLLKQIPGLDLRVLHLVRDSRAVAYSWSKRRKLELGSSTLSNMPGKSLSKAVMVWAIENQYALKIGRQYPYYITLKYEALMQQPASVLDKALRELGLPVTKLSHLQQDSFSVMPTHSVGGNPLRFTQYSMSLRLDESWRNNMMRWQQIALGMLVWPTMRQFNYKL
jgi:hypothetical protein